MGDFLKRTSLILIPLYIALIALNVPELLQLKNENQSIAELEKKFNSGELCPVQLEGYAIRCLEGFFSSYLEKPEDIVLLIQMQKLYQVASERDLNKITKKAGNFTAASLMEYELNFMRIELNLVTALIRVEEAERLPWRFLRLRSHINLVMGKFFASEWIPTLDTYFDGIKKSLAEHPEIDPKASKDLQSMKDEFVGMGPRLEACKELNAFQQLFYSRLAAYVQKARK